MAGLNIRACSSLSSDHQSFAELVTGCDGSKVRKEKSTHFGRRNSKKMSLVLYIDSTCLDD